jgi:uncharacterized protein DUF4260
LVQNIFTPKFVLHLEGAVLLGLSLVGYAVLDGDWLQFALLFFLPDISIAGYLRGSAVGAVTYNVAHAYLLPAILGVYGLFNAQSIAIYLALIWFAHLGFDRLLGFGLKYPTRFSDTHLNRV